MVKSNKHIYAIDLALIVGTLIVLIVMVGYARPLVIAPIDDEVTSETAVLFEFDKADKILIDENVEFTSPREIYVENDLVVNLKPGIYYWKVEGILESEVRELTIINEIDLKVRESDDKYEVINSGNSDLNVDIYRDGNLTESITLKVDESVEKEGGEFIGKQGGYNE